MLSISEGEAVAEQLSAMKFFPSDAGARVAVIRVLQRICHDYERAQWLADRMIDLYGEWPGPIEMRAVYSSRWRPADGIEGNSRTFLEGVPSEREQRLGIGAPAEYLQVEGGEILMLPDPADAARDEPISADPVLCELVNTAVDRTRMRPARIDPDDPVVKKLEQMGL